MEKRILGIQRFDSREIFMSQPNYHVTLPVQTKISFVELLSEETQVGFSLGYPCIGLSNHTVVT